MWLLLVMMHSTLSLDAMKPEFYYYQTQTECEVFQKAEIEKGIYSAVCVKVTWQ